MCFLCASIAIADLRGKARLDPQGQTVGSYLHFDWPFSVPTVAELNSEYRSGRGDETWLPTQQQSLLGLL